MIVFQVFIKLLSSERNIENTMSHLYLNEGSDYFEQNTCKNEVFRSTILHHRLTFQPPIYYIKYKNRKSRLVQMPEAAIGGILWKKMFFKFSQNLQETLAPEKTPVNFAKFLRTPFLQNNFGRQLLKCRHCKNEEREIDCLCCREVGAKLITSAKIPEREGSISLSSFYGYLPNY